MEKQINNIILIIFVVLVFFCCDTDNANKNTHDMNIVNQNSAKAKLNVFVSIIPQKFFIEKIAKDLVNVNVLVQPGESPAIYEPKPFQMKELTNTDMFLSIGVPFERVWLPKIKSAIPKILIVKGDEGIEKIPMIKSYHYSENEEKHYYERKEEREGEEYHHKERLDPHIWLSPSLVKIQAETILKALTKLDKDNSSIYKANYEGFINEIDELDKEIKSIFRNNIKKNYFMVFHPSWAYFAKDYDLVQIPIEVEGKEPSPKELVEFINIAKQKDIKVIFVQPEFSTKSAEAIAKFMGGKTIVIDPLAENWLENLKKVTETFREVLK